MQDPPADRREILSHGGKHVHFYNSGLKIWGYAPEKIFWVRTCTTLNFDREYLWNG